jgi:hypothetical protein
MKFNLIKKHFLILSFLIIYNINYSKQLNGFLEFDNVTFPNNFDFNGFGNFSNCTFNNNFKSNWNLTLKKSKFNENFKANGNINIEDSIFYKNFSGSGYIDIKDSTLYENVKIYSESSSFKNSNFKKKFEIEIEDGNKSLDFQFENVFLEELIVKFKKNPRTNLDFIKFKNCTLKKPVSLGNNKINIENNKIWL